MQNSLARTPGKRDWRKNKPCGYACAKCGHGAPVYDTKRIERGGKVFVNRFHKCRNPECGRTAQTIEEEV